MSRLPPLLVGPVLLCSMLLFSPAAAQDFDNTDATQDWVARSLASDGVAGTVIKASPSSPFLVGFSFWVGTAQEEPTSFRAYLAELDSYQWQTYYWGDVTYTNIWNSSVISPALPSVSSALGNSYYLDQFQRVDISVGLTLDPARHYLAYLRPSEGDELGMAFLNDYAYSSLQTGSHFYESGSSTYLTQQKTAFAADFEPSVVPEPSTVILLGTGLMGLGVVLWRRREEDV